MVEIEEEENLKDLSVTQLKKRMKERGIEASGCTEVPGTPHSQPSPLAPRSSLAPKCPEQKADLIKRLESPGKHKRKGGGSASSTATTAVETTAAPEESPMAALSAAGRQLVLLPILTSPALVPVVSQATRWAPPDRRYWWVWGQREEAALVQASALEALASRHWSCPPLTVAAAWQAARVCL